MTSESIPLWRIVPSLLLGAVAIYLLLPRPRPFPRWWGASAGALALLLAGLLLVRTGVSVEGFLFHVFSGIAIISGVLLVTQSNPARAALAFALVVLSTCGLFLLQAAPFLMAATTIIYAGAIIVTFLFVLMLSQQEGRSDADWRSREPALACLAGFVLLGALLYVLQQTYHNPKTADLLARFEQALTRLEELPAATTADQAAQAGDQLVADMTDKASGLPSVPYEPSLLPVDRALRSFDDRWFDVKMQKDGPHAVAFLKEEASLLRQQLAQAGRTLGDLNPDDSRPMSSLSGPQPSLAIPHDAQGNAPLPPNNTAELGRSLFTDYLLAVELGGTLLLVATIGAIAIASWKWKGAIS